LPSGDFEPVCSVLQRFLQLHEEMLRDSMAAGSGTPGVAWV
jgi:hypothetical protein